MDTNQECSERRREANRRNALASTGPVTEAGKRRSSLNALKGGRYAQPLLTRVRTDRDAEYDELRQELMAAFEPRHPGERMLVEDLASLRWQRRRLERAQAGKQQCALEALDLERRRQLLAMRRTDPPVPYATLPSVGLRWSENSPGKYHMLLNLLESVLVLVRENQFPASGGDALRTIYGRASSARGLEIVTEYERLVKSPPAPNDDGTDAAPLEMKLRAELVSVREEFELYKTEHVEISQARRDAALAPQGSGWRLMIRQLNMIDRQIERKTRLLLAMRRVAGRVQGRSGRNHHPTGKMRKK